MPADAAQRALPGRSRRPLEGGWDFYTQCEIQTGVVSSHPNCRQRMLIVPDWKPSNTVFTASPGAAAPTLYSSG